MHRRTFLLKFLPVVIGGFVSLFHSRKSAAVWPESHFGKGEFATRFQQLFANRPIIDSDNINISLPEIAENGAVVPITISSELGKIRRIYIWVEKNPTPLAAEFELDESVAVYITARIKMAESCPVIIIAEQDDRLLRSQQWVKVMQGGCGTG